MTQPNLEYTAKSEHAFSLVVNPESAVLSTISAVLSVDFIQKDNTLILAGLDKHIALDLLKKVEPKIARNGSITANEIMALIKTYRTPAAAPLIPQREETAAIVAGRVSVLPASEGQKLYVDAMRKSTLTFGVGPAGTGKTYLAVALAAEAFLNKDVKKIILTRPAVEAGEKLGYLPGDMKEKVDPYMQPLYDALNDFLTAAQVEKLIESKAIEICPLAFMRGRTLRNAFIILDEAQNATEMQMKMFLTRLGEGSKMAVVGDKTQNDLPRGVSSGLTQAVSLLKSIDGIEVCELSASDVIRHPLVARIVSAYDKSDATPNK